MRIESAFIAGHDEVDPVTAALEVRSGFQNYVRVPSLPFRYDLGLAMVVQIAFDEYDRPFTPAIEVNRVEDGRVMHHENFTFETQWAKSHGRLQPPPPVCLHLAARFRRCGPAFGDQRRRGSDFAHVDFVVQMVTLEQVS